MQGIQLVCLAALLGVAAADVAALRGSKKTPSGWVLGLQLCQGASSYTLHGLWPGKEDCGGPAFDESQVQDLESKMDTEWLSCKEFGTSNNEFWSHEWEKHGSCSQMSQHDFFAAGLSLLEQFGSICDKGANGGNECSLNCDGPQGPCRAQSAVEAELAVAKVSPAAKQALEDVGAVAAGVLKGFFVSPGFPDVKACLSDAEATWTAVSAAIKALDTKKPTADSVKAGLKDLAAALSDVSKALKACKGGEGELKAFVGGLKQLSSPEKFAFHLGKDLLVNGKDIYAEIKAAVADFKAKKYEPAGEQIGAALEKLVVGKKDKKKVEAETPKIVVSFAGPGRSLASY